MSIISTAPQRTLHCTYKTQGTCSKAIHFDLDDNGVITNIMFEGGCHGNTQGVAALANGRDALSVSRCLAGIDCKGRGTSCPDQLAQAILQHLGHK